MADPKDKTSAATDPKVVGKSGPVRPPVLEGTARPADPAKPSAAAKPEGPVKPDSAAKSDAAKPQATLPPKPEKPKSEPIAAKTESRPTSVTSPSSDSGAGTAWLAGLVGGVVGLGAAYGLALLGYWPMQAPVAQPQQNDPRIATVSAAVPELETVTSTLQSELATLTARVAGLEANPGEATPAPTNTVATDQLAGDIAALGARLDELSAAPNTVRDAAAENAAAIAALEADLSALRQTAAQTETNLSGVTQKVATIETELSEGTAIEAGQARMPLILSGFETAFASGGAYDGEVAALRQTLPDFTIPGPVLENAMTGLKRPDLIARDFNAVLPEILAGRPVNADAGWQEATSDWFRGIIALRPTESVDGEGPEAIIARLEGAIGRGDFVAAKTELDALPAPMRAAAGSVANDIDNQAGAQAFLASLRQAALAGGNGA